MMLKSLTACLVAALGLTLGAGSDGALTLIGAAQAQAKVSPELGKHLTAVQGLLKAGKYKEALAKLRDAEGVANRSADENALIERMRFAGAQGASDAESMVRAYDALKGAGKLGGAENLGGLCLVGVRALEQSHAHLDLEHPAHGRVELGHGHLALLHQRRQVLGEDAARHPGAAWRGDRRPGAAPPAPA